MVLKYKEFILTMIQTVQLNNIEEIQRLNQVATTQEYDLFVHSGNVMVDAKSLLALFALLGRQVSLVASDEICPKHFVKTIKRMKLSPV